MASPWTIVRVDNVDPRATIDDLKQLLGFNTITELKTCKIEIRSAESGERHGVMIVPTEKVPAITALNGVEFYDKQLGIKELAHDPVQTPTPAPASPAPAPPAPAPPAPAPTQEESMEIEEEGEIIAMELDCRLPQWNTVMKKNPDGKVKEAEVVDALIISFPEDPTKRIQPMRGKNIGVFRVQSNDFNQYMDKTLTIRGEELHLKPIRRKPRQQRQEGKTYRDNRNNNYDPDATRITIYDAYDLHFQDIPNEAFDNYFTELGCRIVRQTQPQRSRDNREMLTINRFIVLRANKEDGTVIDLGHKILVDGRHFNIAYFGMQKYCTLCGRKHGRDCPSKQRFNFLRQQREGKTEKRKLYSDSTMRLVNQLACTTDVACMTGGSIGQICNMIPYEDKHEEIVINAGTNEIHYESLHEFAYTVEKTWEKLEKLKEKENIVLVLPSTTTDTAEENAKANFLKEQMSAINGIKVLSPTTVECETSFGRVHPTASGTKDLVQQINANLNNEIILENCTDDVVSPLKYRLVDPVYKVGCSACDNPGYVPTLCDGCKQAAVEINIQPLHDMIQEVKSQMFPDTLQTENEVEMAEVNKKRLSDNNNESSTANKVAKVGQ